MLKTLKNILVISLYFLSLSLMISCKSYSRLNTLDNFARSENEAFTLNQCVLDRDANYYGEGVKGGVDEKEGIISQTFANPDVFVFPGMASIEEQRPYVHLLSEMMWLLPFDTLQIFNTGYVRIYVTPADLSEICAADLFAEQGVKKPYSCTMVDQNGLLRIYFSSGSIDTVDAQGRKTELHLTITDSIRHGFLRNALIAQLLSEGEHLAKDLQLSSDQQRLVGAFRADTSRRASRNRISTLSDSQLLRFLRVEIRDSLYCSSRTTEKFLDEFPLTADVAKDIVFSIRRETNDKGLSAK